MKKGGKELPEKSEEQKKLENIVNNLSLNPEQLKDVIARIEKPTYKNLPANVHKFSKKSTTILMLGDLHMNAKEAITKKPLFDKKRLNEILHIAKEEGAEYIIQTGDVTDGENMRPWHHRNLIVSGFYNVRDYCVNEWPDSGLPTYFIGGNHDLTYLYKPVLDNEIYELIKSKKPDITKDILEFIATQKYSDMVEDICEHIAMKRQDLIYLGMNEANLPLQPQYIKIMLENPPKPKKERIKIPDNATWIRIRHPSKGTAKGQSYQPQLHIEATQPEFKPKILVIGHYHKIDYLFDRNIHAFQAGTMEKQSDWMRTHDLAAHLGAWLATFYYNDDGTIDHVKKRILKYEVNGNERFGKHMDYGIYESG